MKTRIEALALLNEYTKNESLLKHALAVETAMLWYAKNHFDGKYLADLETWGITGLIHDFDYEMYPDPEKGGHPYKGNEILKELGYPEEITQAIMGHALFTNVERTTDMAKTLFACDELTGLITASVLVRPDKSIHNLELKSVKKKFKDRAFARGVSRNDIILGSQEIEVDLDNHIQNVITAMKENATVLGLE